MSTVSQPATSETPSPTATIAPTPKPKPKKKAAVERDKVYVEIYNKTTVKGLAGSTATKATDVGWQVVATDNWVGGNIPSATVYYRSEEHTSELQSLMRISYAVFCLKKKDTSTP